MAQSNGLVVGCVITTQPKLPINLAAQAAPYIRDREFPDRQKDVRTALVVEDSDGDGVYQKVGHSEQVAIPHRLLFLALTQPGELQHMRKRAVGEDPGYPQLVVCVGSLAFCERFVGICADFRSYNTRWMHKLGNVVKGSADGEIVWIDALDPGEVHCITVSEAFAARAIDAIR